MFLDNVYLTGSSAVQSAMPIHRLPFNQKLWSRRYVFPALLLSYIFHHRDVADGGYDSEQYYYCLEVKADVMCIAAYVHIMIVSAVAAAELFVVVFLSCILFSSTMSVNNFWPITI